MANPADRNNKNAFRHKEFLARQSNLPGVYQMFDTEDKVLYVGKARALKKRLASYFQKQLAPKTMALVSRIARIEVTPTPTETDALLLEQNLIKQQRPPYNILLRDDKSYPYLFVSTEDEYPRMELHRGARRAKGRYFGPYPNSHAVRESLQFLQKVFRIRQCDDNFFKNRTRPCLQYQIRRCTAPCVGAITPPQYAEDVRHSLMFLEGKEEKILEELGNAMETAATLQKYEEAANYRDQITFLRQIREPRAIEEGDRDVDVLAMAVKDDAACVQVITVRHGRVLGSRSYFPQLKMESDPADILSAFISQYYLGGQERMIPPEIILDRALSEEGQALQEALTHVSGKKVILSHRVRRHRAKWQILARDAAEQNLLSRLETRQSIHQRFEQLQEVLGLDSMPTRIECFDVSHSSGEATVASCVVFNTDGPLKSDYRRFNITEVRPGDDYAAMKQALERRYTRVQQEDGRLPDVLLIDGGKGQLSQAREVITSLQLSGVVLLGIAKGSTRKAGFETLVLEEENGNWREQVLDSHHPALHLLQQVRDEAHRFAITGHQQRRDKKRRGSVLENIPGVGASRRRALLKFFGGQQEVARAGIEELQKVPGISAALAQAIYDAYH